MAMDVRLSELLEELYDSGRSPEELCGDFPELLPELKERWRQVRRLEAELDAAFPPEREGRGADPGPSPPGDHLPRILGYEVERLLGRGGMGVVFRARHLRLNRVVALKLALAGAYAAPRERERFQREAEAVAALRHPHVVQVYDVGDSEGRPYYTMELVEGGSLAERGKPFAPREAAALLRSLAGAVGAAHADGIIHRDLKPANVLLERDGTPKVGDFGLSRRLDDATGLTLHGAVLGTPSYMAPEQAAGAPAGPDKAVDIYALGAILYELLAGRPPFRGSTPAETIRQVIHADPVPPARHNPRTPRDLETICLRCLAKDPARRYPSAEALGEDLRRFLDGEAIEARPEGTAARAWRRARRRPATFALALGLAPVAAGLIGVSLWLARERAATTRRAEAEDAAIRRMAAGDLREMAQAQERKSWDAARAALERARGRLGDRRAPELRRPLEQGRRDLDLAARLDSIRIDRARSVGGVLGIAGAYEGYDRAFLEAGLADGDEEPEAVAARVRASNIRTTLVDALDDWSTLVVEPNRKGRLLRVAGLASPEQAGWAREARDPEARRSRPALERLAASAPPGDPPVPLLLAIAEDLQAAGADPIPFLGRVQQAHPDDFWANFQIASTLIRAGRSAEALRYSQAALSIRSDVAIVHNNVGHSLSAAGRWDDAIGYFRSALRLDPRASNARYNLGSSLRSAGRLDEAIEQFRLGFGIDTDNPLLHAGLGETLAAGHRDVEALGEFASAIELDPRLSFAQASLRATLIRLGRPEEARAAWRSAIEAAPDHVETRDGYAEFCLFLGHEADYRAARGDLLRRSGDLADPQAAERAGRACLLLPGSRDETARAAALIDRALADPLPPPLAWARPYFLLAKGLAEHRLDRHEAAIATLRGDAAHVMGPCPLLIAAMAQHRSGRLREARGSLARGVGSFEWGKVEPGNREHWIYQILRREAEALIPPDMAAGPTR